MPGHEDVFKVESLINSIRGRVDRASAPETADSGSIPGRVKPRLKKLVVTASLLDVQH